MPTLFSYCIPYDAGAAPNPYWGVCTLAICKPKIRLAAQVGDWVVGTGSVGSPIGDVSGRVVYAMQVTRKMEMWEYDRWTKECLPEKVPDWHHPDHRRRLGDSLYDFSTHPPRQRQGVHDKGNRARDLSGKFVLLSTHFFYFGDQPKPLPPRLLSIVKQGRGHRSTANAPYIDRFLAWIHALGIRANTLIGKPQIELFADDDSVAKCAAPSTGEGTETHAC